MLGDLRHWAAGHGVVGRLAAVVGILLVAWVLVRLLSWFVTRMYWNRVLEGQPPGRADELRRSQRQQTLVTVVQSLVRYVVYGVAVLCIVAILARGVALAAVIGSLMVVVVGFGLQRVFGDIVAGVMLLFEGHYAVGDYVHVHQLNVAGFVEELTLRSTVLRTLAGDRIVVLNGSIQACTRAAGGYRDFRLELVATGPLAEVRSALDAAIAEADASAQQRFLLGPRIEEMEPLTESRVRVELRAVVPPTLEWIVERRLVEQVADALGARLHGTVDVYDISDAAFQAYRTSVLVPS